MKFLSKLAFSSSPASTKPTYSDSDLEKALKKYGNSKSNQALENRIINHADIFEHPEVLLNTNKPEEFSGFLGKRINLLEIESRLQTFTDELEYDLIKYPENPAELVYKLVYLSDGKIGDCFRYLIFYPLSVASTQAIMEFVKFLEKNLSALNYSFWLEDHRDRKNWRCMDIFLYNPEKLAPFNKTKICPIKVQLIQCGECSSESYSNFDINHELEELNWVKITIASINENDKKRPVFEKFERSFRSKEFGLNNYLDERLTSGSFMYHNEAFVLPQREEKQAVQLKFKADNLNSVKLINGNLYLVDNCCLWSEPMNSPSFSDEKMSVELEYTLCGLNFGSVVIASLSESEEIIKFSFFSNGESAKITSSTSKAEVIWEKIYLLDDPQKLSMEASHQIKVKILPDNKFEWKVQGNEKFLTNGFSQEPSKVRLGILRDNGVLTSKSYVKDIVAYFARLEQQQTASLSQNAILQSKIEKYREMIVNNKLTQKSLLFYVEPQVRKSFDSQADTFDLLFDIQSNFLDEDSLDAKIFVLFGEKGSGKTLFGRYLQHIMLVNEDQRFSHWLPVIINLSEFDGPASSLVSDTLREQLDLPEEQVRIFQDEVVSNKLPQLFLIFEGYDELKNKGFATSQLQQAINSAKDGYLPFWEQHNLSLWGKCKVLITSTKFLSEEISTQPGLATRQQKTIEFPYGSVIERIIAPFSSEAISFFLKKFVRLYSSKYHEKLPTWKAAQEYEKAISSFQLKAAASSPELLSIIAQVFPQIFQKFSQTKQQPPKKLTIRLFFKHFTTQSIKRSIQRCTVQGSLGRLCLHGETPTEVFRSQAQRHASALKALNVSKVSLKLSGYESECLSFCLTKGGLTQFAIGSLVDYFIAEKLEKEIRQYSKDVKDLDFKALSTTLLNQDHVLENPKVIEFLVDATEDDVFIKNRMVKLIESMQAFEKTAQMQEKEPTQASMFQEESKGKHTIPINKSEIQLLQTSKSSFSISFAAKNLLKLLNIQYYDFSGMNLSYLRLSGADLSNGIFEKTNFSNTNLSHVNFEYAWLKDADFSNAEMTNTRFGERPSLEIDGSVQRLTFSSDGSMLGAIAGRVLVIFRWNEETGSLEEMKKFKVGYDIYDLDLTPNLKKMVSVDDKYSWSLWDIETSSFVEKRLPSLGKAYCCRFSPDGTKILTGGSENSLWIWDEATLELKTELKAHTSIVRCCEFSSDGRLFISGSDDRTVRIWNSSNYGLIKRFIGHRKTVTKCGFCPNRKNMWSTSEDGTAKTWDFVRSHPIKTFRRKKEVRCLSWNSESTKAAVACDGKTDSCIWDFAEGSILQPLIGHNDGIISCTFTPSDHKVITGSWDSHIRVWDVVDGRSLKGANTKGLNIAGANIENVGGISDSNLKLFCQKSSYNELGVEETKRIILNGCLGNITDVDLNRRSLTEAGLAIIGKNKTWKSLKSLNLSGNSLGKGLAHIAANTTWSNLEELRLSKNQIETDEIAKLVQNVSWKKLTLLHLDGNMVDNQGAKYLSKAAWPNLTELKLSCNALSGIGVEVLASNTTWSSLKILDLQFCNIDDAGGAKLGSNKSWINLEVLQLADNLIEQKGAAGLGSNTSWVNLKKLDLTSNQVDDKGAIGLGANASWKNLEELYLASNKIGAEGAQGLGVNKNWQNLRKLDLLRNKVKNGAAALGGNVAWSNLEEINLTGNLIGNEGSAGIGLNTAWKRMKILSLSVNEIGDLGAGKIGNNVSWENLQELYLFWNQIGDKGVVEIASNQAWKLLKVLNLHTNDIGDEGAIAIGKNTTWVNLEVLTLNDNRIKSEGAAAIGMNTVWKNLKKLSLSANQIGPEGAIEIGRNTTWTELEELYLHANKIENEKNAEGALMLASNMTWKKLKKFRIQNNKISSQGYTALRENPLFGAFVQV